MALAKQTVQQQISKKLLFTVHDLMPKLSKRQWQSRKNSLSLQKYLDDNGRYQKKRATVEIADDAEDWTAQQEWN